MTDLPMPHVRPEIRPIARPAPRTELIGVRAGALRIGRNRLALACLAFAACFLALTVRLIELTALGTGEPATEHLAAATGTGTERADIVDRNGTLLATNLATASLYADAAAVPDPEAAADRLLTVLPGLDRATLVARLSSKRRFVWLQRHLTPRQQYAVNRLGIPGLHFQDEEERIYPHGRLLAHVLGYTDIDGNGIAGVEKSFNRELKDLGRSHDPLQLSIDIRVQHALRDELARAVGEFHAIGAAGVVLDAASGEVLGLASLPDFDPNHPGASPDTTLFNRATLGVYELGSVFKAFTVAMALDTGSVGLAGGYDATRPLHVARFTIHDDHPKKRWLSVPEILMYSSNIGAAKMALDVGAEEQQRFLGKLGLLRRLSIRLPEVGDPLRPSPWRDINTMTVAFGHGVAVSPLQYASAFSALINGGVLVPPTLLKRDRTVNVGRRVISPRTSEEMRRLLRLVVTGGTGGKADVPGYLVGGKTGTAEKPGVHGYHRKALLSSFVAAFPMTAPRYVVYVLLDEPQGNKSTWGFASGGWTAAPTAGRIVERVAPLMKVEPVNAEAPDVRRAMAIEVNTRGPKLASY